MSALGLVAVLLAAACIGVLAHDLWRGRTAFAQFAASRNGSPGVFWLGISAWTASLLGCALVAIGNYLEHQVCRGAEPCIVTVALPE